MKAYVINLDRSPERLAWFMAQAQSVGLKNVVRIPAVDGRTLPMSEIARLQSLLGGDHPMSTSELALLLSQRACWQALLDSGQDWAFVAEDDIHMTPELGSLTDTSQWIPPDADIVKAETTPRKQELASTGPTVLGTTRALRLYSYHSGAGAYFLSRDAARELIAFTDNRVEPADAILFSPKYGLAGSMAIYQLSPAPCLQDVYMDSARQVASLASVIDADREAAKAAKPKLPASAKFRREVKRIANRVTSWMRRSSSGGRRVFVRIPFSGSNVSGEQL